MRGGGRHGKSLLGGEVIGMERGWGEGTWQAWKEPAGRRGGGRHGKSPGGREVVGMGRVWGEGRW